MNKFLITVILILSMALSACDMIKPDDIVITTKYTDPNTGAIVLVVYENGEMNGEVTYIDENGLTVTLTVIHDELTGTISYINPENGLETTIELRNSDSVSNINEERG